MRSGWVTKCVRARGWGMKSSATQKGEGKTGGAIVLLLHDLKGNVVGEAALSETETKLLKTYNSIEFGVPNGKEAPPKYAWLGAAGVAGELPSGVITQDGVTYVPQTGRPLQTEGVPLPAPENASTPFVRPVEAWIGITAEEGGARELAAAEQERRSREVAEQPPGAVPFTPPSWWCGGEYGPCEGEESGGGGGGCSGMNACAASVHAGCIETTQHGNNGYGCEIWGSWGAGEFLAGEISGWGHWKCGASVPGFEMQIEAYGWGAQEFEGHTGMLGTPGHKITKSWHRGKTGEPLEHTWKCPATGSWYHLWVWGRQLGTHGHTQWSASGWERRIGSCTNQGPVDMSPVGQAGEPS
jgi:hypothetical protein